ncbi:pentapeptide repeat-containing protein [Pseudoduganella sp. FT25W]|uniref:Pentapeptide repeat-containing protein n=1 Tax=Duganella alba TaxID=2666081 RepID=A0A6L5QGF9_9BURK|nr:pentapeptide repeat-containing protein [Duganella alba]MRX08864.1 pentapeptide repeat-containing protein [Duganella alba]MRX18842.1 pentapeptide repeat-containing protein [Duganella alba]
MNSNSTEGCTPAQNRAELEQRYAAGERYFPATDLSEADLSGIELDGADFEKHSWFHSADFSGASLRGTSFRECNLKCVNFSNADLTDAILESAAIELIKTNGALTENVKVRGATFYGCELADGDMLPSWEW